MTLTPEQKKEVQEHWHRHLSVFFDSRPNLNLPGEVWDIFYGHFEKEYIAAKGWHKQEKKND